MNLTSIDKAAAHLYTCGEMLDHVIYTTWGERGRKRANKRRCGREVGERKKIFNMTT